MSAKDTPTTKAQPGHDVIGGSKGPVDIGKDPLESHPGDTITGSRGPVDIGTTPAAPAPSDSGVTLAEVEAQQQGETPRDKSLGNKDGGERDWTDVHNRVLSMAGTNGAAIGGSLTYAEGETTDEDIEKLETDLQKAGAAPGAGRRVGKALQSMGYSATFKAAPKASTKAGTTSAEDDDDSDA